MAQFKDLTPVQCILLAVNLASDSNIKALHSFTLFRPDVFDPELVLRILLTYLPESTAPSEYVGYVGEVASRLYLDVEREEVKVDTTSVRDLSELQAQKRFDKLKLLELIPPTFPPHAPQDVLIRFLCHRAYRIDEETGLLNIIPQLVTPFLDRSDYLKTWYVSVLLPVLRFEFEYYPEDEKEGIGLRRFEDLAGKEGINFLLSQTARTGDAVDSHDSPHKSHISRDLKGLVGPWMYGHTERKRRKLDSDRAENDAESGAEVDRLAKRVGKISMSGVSEEDKTGHDWEFCYSWLVYQAQHNFSLATSAIEEWNGPGDIDLGILGSLASSYLDEETREKLDLQYAQAAFAICYAVETDTEATIRGAHGVLARLADLLDFIPPPDLATSVDNLPRIERHATKLEQSQTVRDLLPDALLRPEHPLTTPRLETYMLLQMMVYTAYQFAGLGHPTSIVNAAKLHFYAAADEQLSVLVKILKGLSRKPKKDDSQWIGEKGRLIWLWNWGIDASDETAQNGAGPLGKINRQKFDEEMLKAFVDTSNYDLAIRTFLDSNTSSRSAEQVEGIVLGKAYEAYDAATNGNKTRGGVKRANDIVIAFKSYFPSSAGFRQLEALINATHAVSFYSLTLQHGVPFEPVNIRVAQDCLCLLERVLEQNPGAYTKVDDLISIARNLVAAGLPKQDNDLADLQGNRDSVEQVQKQQKDAERRIVFLAVQAALKEEDFETAYSYIVSRLTPSPNDIEAPSEALKSHRRTTSKGTVTGEEDDISWRAALLAGRYRAASSSPATLRRLEQRTELLSLALLLAPVSALTEILAVWRRCEEETIALQAEQARAEQEFDDRADKRASGALPGTFQLEGSQPDLVLNQSRREVGRMHGSRGDGEVPVSMFDLTRSAARALSRNAFPLRGVANQTRSERPLSRTGTEEGVGMQGSTGSLDSAGAGGWDPSSPTGQQRVRKRDMVANAASGALASGLGWVLGAKPVSQHQQEDEI